jgi:flagellar FliL protein
MSTTTAARENRWGSNSQAGPDSPGGKEGGSAKGEAGDKADKKKGKKGKKKKLMIGVVGLLVVAGAGYQFMAPKKTPPPAPGEVVAMDATTLNLADGHYLKLAVAIELVKGKAGAADFNTSHAAELVIDEFSNRGVVSLSSNTARGAAAADLEKKIKKAYPGKVFDIFITQFVTQ